MAKIIEARYTKVGHLIPANIWLDYGTGLVPVYACKDCGEAIAEGRKPDAKGKIRYPNYYRNRHDEAHRKRVS